MGGKIFQEGHPIVGIGLFAGSGGDELYAVRGLVKIVEAQRPGNQAVTTDESVDSHVVCHELDPAVEDGVIVGPRPVDPSGTGDHAEIEVLGLPAPRLVHERRGDGALSGVSQHLHERAHGVEVGLAPQGNAVVARHGIRVLPEVEVEFPLARRGERAAADFEFKGQAEAFVAGGGDGERPAVAAGLCVARHTHREPQRLCRTGADGAHAGDVDHVGHERRVPVGLHRAQAAAAAVGVGLVGHDVAHETGAHGRIGDDGTAGAESAHAEADAVETAAGPEDSLGMDAFAAPGPQAECAGAGALGKVELLIAHVGRAPGQLGGAGHAVPSLGPVVRLGVGQFVVVRGNVTGNGLAEGCQGQHHQAGKKEGTSHRP